MTKMTPAEAFKATLRATEDLEEAYLAGYAAEGRIGKGKAPDNEGRERFRENGRIAAAARDTWIANFAKGNERKQRIAASRTQQIFAALQSAPMTKAEIMAQTGVPETTIGNIIYRMMREGRIYSTGPEGRAKTYHISGAAQ